VSDIDPSTAFTAGVVMERVLSPDNATNSPPLIFHRDGRVGFSFENLHGTFIIWVQRASP